MAVQTSAYGQFICGVPASIIDLALPWVPSPECSRETSSDEISTDHLRYPSWLWAAWRGSIIHPEQVTYMLKSCVNAFFVLDTKNSGKPRPLDRHESLLPRVLTDNLPSIWSSAEFPKPGDVPETLYFFAHAVSFRRFHLGEFLISSVMMEVERIPAVKLADEDGYTCGLLFSTCTSGS